MKRWYVSGIVVLLIISMSYGIVSAETGWKFRSDLQNSGVYDDGGVRPNGELLWKFQTGIGNYSSPAVSNGVVYVTGEHSFYALDAVTGSKKWEFKKDIMEISCPAVSNGVVYVASMEPKLYALDAITGNEIWEFWTGNYLYCPTVSNGVVYIGGSNGVYALDTSTGSKIWEFKTGDIRFVWGCPAIFNNVLYTIIQWDRMVALDASTGNKIWVYETDTAYAKTPAVSNGVVYSHGLIEKKGVTYSYLYALDAITGSEIWRFEGGFGEWFSSNPAVSNGVVYFGGYNLDHLGIVYAVDATTGNEIWEFKTGGTVSSSPAVSNGVVYFGSEDGNVYALDASTGNEIWKFKTGGPIESSPAISNGVLYIGSNDGYLYAIGRPASVIPNSQLIPSDPNTLQSSTPPINPLPDLTITKISMNQKEDVIAGTLTIENKGSGDAGKFTITYFLTDTLKNDPIFGNTGIYDLDYDSANGLAAGDQRDSKGLKMFTIPGNVPPGSYAVGVFIDSNNVVEESDEENNVVYDVSWVQVS